MLGGSLRIKEDQFHGIGLVVHLFFKEIRERSLREWLSKLHAAMQLARLSSLARTYFSKNEHASLRAPNFEISRGFFLPQK